jgi:hypothetical protein
MEKAAHTKAKKEPTPKKIAPTWGLTPQMRYSTYPTRTKHKTTKKAPTTKKALVPNKAASETTALFSGCGDRCQSLSLKFSMDKTSHTISPYWFSATPVALNEPFWEINFFAQKLSPGPPDPYTVRKLRLSAFCRYNNISKVY